MRHKFLLGVGFFLLGASSCSIQKHIPEGVYLYNGAKVNVIKTPDNTSSTKAIKKSLLAATFPKKNRMILGYPYKVAFWYAFGTPRRKTGIKSWLKNFFGEPPVLSTGVKLKSNEENLLAFVENRGHFKSAVTSAASTKGYKMNVVYDVVLTRPYSIDSIRWSLDSSMVSKDILSIDNKKSLVKSNEQFSLENIKAETRRTDLQLKTKGYYYFNPDYIKTYLDTSVGNHKANIFFSLRSETPSLARIPQTIQSVILFPNYTLIYPPPDTSKTGLTDYKGILIRDTIHQFKPSALVRSLTYKPGSLYNLEVHNESLNRFIKMGAFRFVKSRYEPAGDSAGLSLMNVFYYLTPLKRKSINAELGGFSKSNSFTGAQINVNWKNRNLFGGAEQLNVKTYGAIETSSIDTLKKNNNWRLGGELTFMVPRFIAPFRIKESHYAPPFTRFTLGYEWMRRQLYYTKNFFHFQYDLSWRQRNGMDHLLAPVSITLNNTTAYSDNYLQKITLYPVLQLANRPELLLGTFYNFTYTTRNTGASNVFYLNGTADAAGNIAGLLNKPDSAFSKKIGGAYFAQYIKLEVDARYTRKLAGKAQWANRMAIGVGMPYGNSAYLPFAKQFIIGGANSLRGFKPRQVGPGKAFTSVDQQVTYPQVGGDYKVELQTEYRFQVSGPIYGAVFAEAGNIWTKNDLLYGKSGQINGNLLNSLAVDGGLGIRFDAKVLIIRLDVGVPLRKPWLPLGEEWVLRNIDLKDRQWRRDNLIFNFGIGYPF
jgi:outer membrane protein assembly factor BamA